jgi:nitrogen fixation protein NifX
MAMALERRLTILDTGTEADWIDTAVKVAFASTDMRQVNQHFGSAESFAIYAVDLEHIQLLEVNQFGLSHTDGMNIDTPAAAGHAMDNEDKLGAKMNALEGCIAVYSQAVGASAVSQLKARGIQPIKVSPGADVLYLLKSLQEELRSGPTAWLARAIGMHSSVNPARFDVMEDEGWDE